MFKIFSRQGRLSLRTATNSLCRFVSENISKDSAQSSRQDSIFNQETNGMLKLDKFFDRNNSTYKSLSAAEKFKTLANYLSKYAGNNHLERSVDVINDLLMLKHQPTPNELISIILTLERMDFTTRQLGSSATQIPHETRLALECYVLNHLEPLLSTDFCPVQKAFLGSVRPKGAKKTLSAQDFQQCLESVTKTSISGSEDKFVPILLLSRIVLENQAELAEEDLQQIETAIAQNLKSLKTHQTFQYIESLNFTNLPHNSFWLYAIEQKIADELGKGITQAQLTRLISYLAEYNGVFRQKLVYLLNEKAKPHLEKLPLQSLINLVYINYVNKIVDHDIETIDLTNCDESEYSKLTPNDVIRLKTLDVFGSEFTKKPKSRVNSMFQRLVQESADDQISLKAYMLAFHSANEDAMKIVRKRLEPKGSISAAVLAPLIIELGSMYENRQISHQTIKDHFEWLIRAASQQLNRMDEQTAYVVSEAIAQMTDSFDSQLG